MNQLKTILNKLYKSFDRSSISPDPLEFVHKFNEPLDQEIVGLIASSLAYGRVEMILKSINYILDVMERMPYRFTMGFNPLKQTRLFNNFSHRFNNGKDIACLVYFAKQMIEEGGSIKGFFMKGYNPDDKNIKPALTNFSNRVLQLDCLHIYSSKKLPEDAGVRFFFPSPENGSPCKRLNLYLRWMVRRKDVDLGLWEEIHTSKLVIPLDTHIARISKNIGLTKRKSPDWKMAEEITENLKRLDPQDPVKYDFSLCRLGILDKCPKNKDPEKCRECLIKGICVMD